jgi:hypothetical protein
MGSHALMYASSIVVVWLTRAWLTYLSHPIIYLRPLLTLYPRISSMAPLSDSSTTRVLLPYFHVAQSCIPRFSVPNNLRHLLDLSLFVRLFDSAVLPFDIHSRDSAANTLRFSVRRTAVATGVPVRSGLLHIPLTVDSA